MTTRGQLVEKCERAAAKLFLQTRMRGDAKEAVDALHAAIKELAASPSSVPESARLAMSVARRGYLSMRATGQACLPEFTESAIAALDAALTADRMAKKGF